MFLDTSHNSLVTVLSNIYNAFHESATKMWMYARCMPTSKQPNTKLLIKTFEGLIELAFVLLKSKGRNKWGAGYACAVSKVQVEWLALNAFTNVLQVRQSKYTQLLVWMEERIMQLNIKDAACQRLKGTVSAQPDKD
ncbi:hypothetical protein BJ878DRAFT_117297 [Calycina marina]|uniref:Telomerase reverse transcriptase n=1 Tax=Calycina marina TaxID=1763456 RepID=A0A9P7Z9Q7_9HELO|nr:hypothetical protein BJ878DRAFT_117297 [Calycina marina]